MSIQGMQTKFQQQTINVTTSAGIASLVGDDNISRLFQRADKALYKAKGSGRNKVFTAAQLRLEPIEHLVG